VAFGSSASPGRSARTRRVFRGRDRAGRAATVYVTGVPDNRQHLIDAFVAAMCHR
jgi:D-alanyl-D-alanine carboxypeptidase